jgi:hypothetical protein
VFSEANKREVPLQVAADDAAADAIEKMWIAEVRQRIEARRGGASDMVSWEELRTELRAT